MDWFVMPPTRYEEIRPFAVPANRTRIALGIRDEPCEEVSNRAQDLDGLGR